MKVAGTSTIVLGFLEVRQDVIPAPAAVPKLRPVVIILGLSANIDQPVDGTRSAQSTSARPVNLPAVHPFLGFCVEAPIVVFVKHCFPVTDRDVDPQVVVFRSGFEK